MKKGKPGSKLYVGLIFFFLYFPLLVMVLFSFNSADSTSVFGGFSLRWYKSLFQDSYVLSAFELTIKLALISSVTATVLGTAAAVGIDRMKKKYLKSTVMAVTNIPMMNPDIVTGYSLMLLFVFVGRTLNAEVLGFWTLLIAHTTFNLPYVILSVLPKLRQMDVHLTEAAQDLGCTPFRSFLKVELPAILPGILTGFIMSITLSIDDFIISYFTSGNLQTLPIAIFSMTKKRFHPDMYALSTLLFVTILALLIIINVIGARNEKKMYKAAKKK